MATRGGVGGQDEAGAKSRSPPRHARGDSLHRHRRDGAWTSVKPGRFSWPIAPGL